jgi:hypothetical protein
MNDAYLAKIIVDVSSRTFKLFSSECDYKEEHCDSQESFMNVLEFVRSTVSEDLITYEYSYLNQN